MLNRTERMQPYPLNLNQLQVEPKKHSDKRKLLNLAPAKNSLKKNKPATKVRRYYKYWIISVPYLATLLFASSVVAAEIYVDNGNLFWRGKKSCVEWGYIGGTGFNGCQSGNEINAYPCRGTFASGEKMDVQGNVPRGTVVQVRRCI